MPKRRPDLPIVIGAGLRKGLMTLRRGGGFELWIVWLKRDYKTGEEYDINDIDKIQAVLRFADRESVEQTAKALQWMLKTWKEERKDDR